MRNKPDPNYKYEQDELDRLKAEPWMMELLNLNPDYCSWGPHEDYMAKEGSGWDSRVLCGSWKEFRTPGDLGSEPGWTLDDMNECVNFYFQVSRESEHCEKCDSSGYNPATKKIYDDFYDFDNTGRRWRDEVTQDEVDALVAQDRLRKFDKENHVWVSVPRTAEEVNQANHCGARSLSECNHDAINMSILVETRAKRLGVWGVCSNCKGRGDVYTEPEAHVNLVLWMLHPRKGCSRGVEIKNIEHENLPEIFAYLREAAKRNAQRFSKIPLPEVAV